MGERVGGVGERTGGAGERMGGVGERVGGVGERAGGLGEREADEYGRGRFPEDRDAISSSSEMAPMSAAVEVVDGARDRFELDEGAREEKPEAVRPPDDARDDAYDDRRNDSRDDWDWDWDDFSVEEAARGAARASLDLDARFCEGDGGAQRPLKVG